MHSLWLAGKELISVKILTHIVLMFVAHCVSICAAYNRSREIYIVEEDFLTL